jgi:hypothetical protein
MKKALAMPGAPIRKYWDVATAENRMEQRTKSGLCKLLLGKGLVGAWRFELQTSCAQVQLRKIYLVGPSSFVLRHGTRFWT